MLPVEPSDFCNSKFPFAAVKRKNLEIARFQAFIYLAALQSAMLNCKQSYGGTLNALLQLYGDSMEAKAKIFDMVVGDAVSKRLKEEGVLWLEV